MCHIFVRGARLLRLADTEIAIRPCTNKKKKEQKNKVRGGRPGQVSVLSGCGVEYTPKWVVTSGLHGMEW